MKKSASRSKLLHCFRPMVDMDDDMAIEHESSDDLSPESGDEMRSVSEKKRTLFSRSFKAVLFDTVLAKRVHRDAKCDKQKSKVLLCNGEMDIVSKNRFRSSSSSSSSTSDSTKCDREEHEDNKSEDDSSNTIDIHRRNNIGLCFILIGLITVTVLCGRLLAIVFTSVWLYALSLCYRWKKSQKKSSRVINS